MSADTKNLLTSFAYIDEAVLAVRGILGIWNSLGSCSRALYLSETRVLWIVSSVVRVGSEKTWTVNEREETAVRCDQRDLEFRQVRIAEPRARAIPEYNHGCCGSSVQYEWGMRRRTRSSWEWEGLNGVEWGMRRLESSNIRTGNERVRTRTGNHPRKAENGYPLPASRSVHDISKPRTKNQKSKGREEQEQEQESSILPVSCKLSSNYKV